MNQVIYAVINMDGSFMFDPSIYTATAKQWIKEGYTVTVFTEEFKTENISSLPLTESADWVKVSEKQLKGEVKQRNLFRRMLVDAKCALNSTPIQFYGTNKTTHKLADEIETLLKENP